jgi:hypothetical protein
MRQALSLGLALLMVTHSGPAAFGADSVTSQITGMPAGTSIEIHLKNKEKLQGARGDASSSVFTLLNPTAGNRQVAFDDVTSVKRLNQKSHTTRNVLIVVGVAVVVVIAVLAIHIKNHPLG